MLQRFAAQHDVAVVVLTQTATKMQAGAAARLVPAIGGPAWEAGVAWRVVLWRDWGEGEGAEVRFARCEKRDGGMVVGEGVGFVVCEVRMVYCFRG